MAKYISKFTGQEIDQRLDDVGEKFGDAYFDSATNIQYLFKSTDDKLAWLSGDASITPKVCQFEFSGTVRRMTVVNEMESKNLYYTQTSESAIITVGFKSEEKGITDTSWNEVLEDARISVEVDRGVTGSYDTIVNEQLILNGNTFSVDVIKYLATGNNRVRVMAVGVETGSTANIVYSVLLTSMYLAPAKFAWNVPFIEGQAYSLGGLYIGGNIDKVLKIKVSNEQTYSKLYEINLGTQTNTSIAYYYNGMVFPTEGTGIYTVEMWLDANGLESEHLYYNIMCVASEDVRTAQLIAVSDVLTTVKNYNTNKIFSYAVYNGGATTANPIVNVSAIINNTPTVITRNEELTNVPTGEINDYTVDLEIDSQETNIQLYSSIELGDCKQEAVYAVDNSASYPAVAGAEFYLNPANRSNTQGNKETIINESNIAAVPSEYTATWSGVSFVDGMDGWTTDNDGRKCLRLPAKGKVEIDYAPFANASTRTLEISYKVENASDYNEDIITLASELTSQFVGARVKPTNVLMHSTLLKTDDLMQGYNTKDEELVHLLITVIKDYKQIGNLAQIYVNGVKKCSFEWSNQDTFAHNGKVFFGSMTADLSIYKMRVYKEAFDWIMAAQNFISCLPDTASKKAAYDRLHSVLNDGNNIDFDKVKNAGLNYFTLRLPAGAKLPSITSPSSVPHSRLVVNIQQNPSFIINGVYEDEETEGQGTTAMNYWDWNLRWKTSKVRITAKKNWASSMHSHKMGGTALFNDLYQMIVGANEANGRVAVEQYGAYGFLEVLKEGTTDQYDYIPIGLYTIGQDKGDKATFGFDNAEYKDTLIHMEGTDHSPKAVGMDYPWDKLNVATNTDGDANLGVQKADGSVIAAWEIGASGKAKTDPARYEYLTQEFKPAYMCDYLNTSMIVGLDAGITIADVNANLSAFRAMETDNGYTNADCLIWVDGEYDTYYYDVLSEKYTKDGNNVLSMLDINSSILNSMVEAISNASDDVDELLFPAIEGFTDVKVSDYKKLQASMKLGDFSTLSEVGKKNFVVILLRCREYKNTMENYWHLRDNLFHYCFIILFAATDNFKKNTYPYKFGTLANGSRWRWRQDDLDTMLDINNQGLANKIYSILNGDKSGTTHLFRGNTSYHWTNIQFYYENEIKGMMLEILTAMASLSDTGSSLIEKAVGCVRKYFWDKAQDYFTKSAYNIDAEAYEEAWAAMKNGTYKAPVHPLQQSLGSHYEAERAFVELRFLFMASLYGFGAFAVGNDSDTTLGQISFRPAQGDNTFHLTPAINMNPTILVGDSDSKSAGERLNAGETADITISTDGDTSIYIQGTDYLSDIGDFSKVNLYAENPALTVSGKRLQKLKVGDENPSEVTTLLKTLNVLSCPSLSEVDARNTDKLTGTVDLSNCPRLTKALFGGSSVGEIVLPKGSKITEFELPDSLTNLSLVNLPNLDNDGLQYGELNALTYLRLENNKNIEGFAMLKATYEAGSPLTNIRVIGFDYDGTADDVTLLATLANGGYFGIDADGSRNNNIIPVIEGTLNVDGSIYEDDANIINEKYGMNLVLNVTGGYYVRFADPEVLRVLLANNVGDGVGITTEDIEKVTGIAGWFYNNTTIESFDELEKFSGVSIIAPNDNNDYQAFRGCTSLKSIKLPSSINKVGRIAFGGCTSLSYIKLHNTITTIGTRAFDGCTSLSIDLDLPNLTTLGYGSFYNTAIKKVISLGSIASVAGSNNQYTGTFSTCKNLTEVNLPETVTSIGVFAFYGCASLNSINFPNSIKNIAGNAFQGCTSLEIEDLSLPNLETLGQNAFYGVKIKKISNMGKVTALPTASTSTQNFGDKSVLEEIVLPDGLASVPNDSFNAYSALTTIHNISIVNSIGASAFRECVSLQGDIYIPNVKSIEQSTFRKTKITSLDAPSVTIIRGGSNVTAAFYECLNLKHINVPKVETIEVGVFENCESIDSIYLPSIKNLTGVAFRNCISIRCVILGENIANIGQYQFGDSSAKPMGKLEYIVCKAETPPTITTTAWYNSNNCPIHVPDSSVEAYRTTSGWSSYADRIKPLSEYDVRILTYNEDGNGGYNLYQVATYDTSKNDYVMGVAVHGDNGDFVIHPTPQTGTNIWVDSVGGRVRTHLGYENTQLMLEAYPNDGTNNYIHNKCSQVIFANGDSGFLMSNGEGYDCWKKKQGISSAFIKLGLEYNTEGDHWTSSTGYVGNKWMGTIRMSNNEESTGSNAVENSTTNIKQIPSYPMTKLPEGLEW